MSYEGYTQNLCANGHFFYEDAYVAGACFCGAPTAWSNPVDDTNEEHYGVVDMDKLFIKEAKGPVCPTCGHEDLTNLADIHRIPSPEETKKLRRYYPGGGKTFKYCTDNDV